MSDERYQRQVGLFGPNGQEKLRRSRVAVIGGNLLADFTLAALASLGVGTLFPVARERTAKQSFIPFAQDIRSYERFFHKFNSELEVYPVRANVASRNSVALIPYADVIIDVTHDPVSKYCSGIYAKDKGVVLLGYAPEKLASVLHARHAEHLEDIISSYTPSSENAITCEIAAGLLADEVRKILLPRPNEGMRNISLAHEPCQSASYPKTAIIGAGALGTWVGIGLALMGLRATVIDNDRIEVTNLNRQFLYYDAVGRRKAETLAKKLSGFGQQFRACNKRFEGQLDDKYELLVSCVDNLHTRSLLNRVAVNDSISLVNGGTDPHSGNIEAYVPGVTACIACQGGTVDAPENETATSCLQHTESSTVISNLIVSGLMLKTIDELLAGKTPKRIMYSSEFGILNFKISSRANCKCREQVSRSYTTEEARI